MVNIDIENISRISAVSGIGKYFVAARKQSVYDQADAWRPYYRRLWRAKIATILATTSRQKALSHLVMSLTPNHEQIRLELSILLHLMRFSL
jgi:hypothetical protein